MAQLGLLFYMLKSKEVIKMVDNKALYFPNKDYRLLAREIISFYKMKGYIDVAELLTDLDDSMLKTVGLTESLEFKDEYTNDIINDYINAINEINIENECERLEKLMQEETDIEKKQEIGNRILSILKSKGDMND